MNDTQPGVPLADINPISAKGLFAVKIEETEATMNLRRSFCPDQVQSHTGNHV